MIRPSSPLLPALPALPAILACALGCAPPPPPAPPPSADQVILPAAPPPAPLPPAGADADPPAAPPRRPRACFPDGTPPPPALPAPPPPAAPLPCRPRDKRADQAVARDLKAEYQPVTVGARAVVRFGCDDIDARVKRIMVERGSGHGGNLEIWRLTRQEPGAQVFEVLGIARAGYFAYQQGSGFKIARGTLPARDVESALTTARAALTAEISEVAPRALPGQGLGRRGFASSRDFLSLVYLEDAGGRALRGWFAGYVSSADQARYLPVRRAEDALEPLIARLTPQDEAPDPEVRAMFTAQLLAAAPRFGEDGMWWVRERYVELAAALGTAAALPALLPLLQPDPEDRSASAGRTRDAALAAMAAITGWDARVGTGADNKAVPPEEAAREYLEACGGPAAGGGASQ